MAFHALLFSKSSETNAAITAACTSTGIQAEVCSDIFTAIEKGTKQAFSCVIADWAQQPEASFLLKRARESNPNRNTVAIAVVDRDPTPVELRDNRLEYLIYRPISTEQAIAVLGKASGQMQPAGTEHAALLDGEDNDASGTAATSGRAGLPEHSQPIGSPEADAREDYGGTARYEGEPRKRSHALGFRGACAAVLVLGAAFCLWRSHEILGYVSRTPEGEFHAIGESVAALFRSKQTAAISAANDPQAETDFNREAGSSNAQPPALRVAATASTLAETLIPLRKAQDFPLPVPTLEQQDVAPIRKQHAPIPESMKNSALIAPPIVVTVGPAQMMPVSAPRLPAAVQPFSEPVAVSEEAERALLVHTVSPVYPAEALAQKLHGSVVLQARVGRDGSVEDLKIVRGYFILGRAAITAVRQWRFQPYTLNGHAAATQTLITINFSYPPG